MGTESEDSIRAQIERLEPGESVAKAKLVDLGDVDGLRPEATRMRKTLESAIVRAKRSCPGRRFTVETGHFFTRAESLAIVAVLTRVA